MKVGFFFCVTFSLLKVGLFVVSAAPTCPEKAELN